MQKLLRWLDEYGLTVFAGFLLMFIPLYPKIPLFDVIPGYIVRVRVEDFLIGIALVLWFVQLIRKKTTLHPLMTKLVIVYIVIGLLSCISAIVITKSVPLSTIHIQKLFLHYFRRIEYFSLFFIFFSAIKSYKQLKVYLSLSIVTMIAVAIYGYGQKYLYWPVYSTMNREFSKGWRLYLTDHARVPSTFGGHYDAAAYTMIIITVMLAIVWYAKNKWIRLAAFIAYLSGFWLLILTASRTSFIAYLAAISLVAFISIFIKGFWWPIPRYLVALLFSLVVMLSFGDLSERFAQVFGLQRIREQFANTLLAAKVEKPKNGQAVNDVQNVASPSDEPPSTSKPSDNKGLPGDVYENIPDYQPVVDAEGRFTGEVKTVSRTYSDNAYKYGLSAAIRMDTLWPRAIAGFKRNPILGSGYSTLTKSANNEFTEAESTDNDYLRNLGETGILGVLSFFGIVFAGLFVAVTNLKSTQDPLIKAFLIGYIAAGIGLLINAIYIDVYEASKVAMSYWAITGMVYAVAYLNHTQPVLNQSVPAAQTTTIPSPELQNKKTKAKKTNKKK